MRIPEPNWDDLEGRWWTRWVEKLSDENPNKSRYLGQIESAASANKELEKECIVSARVNPGQDQFEIKGARPFYEQHPECFGYGQWTRSENQFETATGAKDSIMLLKLPNIDIVDIGWGGQRSQKAVERCNLLWHNAVQKEVQDGILVGEGLLEECERRPMPIPALF